MNLDELDAFTRSYIETALWSSLDFSDESGGEPLDEHYGVEDIAPETLRMMVANCADFRVSCAEDLAASGQSDERAGHNFWLTRNRHGAGFWDDGLGAIGERLTRESHAWGSFDLYVGDDGMVHGQ